MTDVPQFDPGDTTPERVDNTNAINRALLAELVAATDVDVAAVVEQMAADGKLSTIDVDAVAEKGWIARKRIDDAWTEPVAEAMPVDVEAVKR